MDRRGFLRNSLITAGAIGFLGIAAACEPMTSSQLRVYNMINRSRNEHWLGSLYEDAVAREKAQNWAEHMSRNRQISHSNLSDGMDGVNWRKIGENVGVGGTLEDVHRAFLNSPEHKANILSPEFTHVGTGVAYNSGNNLYYVAHVFYA